MGYNFLIPGEVVKVKVPDNRVGRCKGRTDVNGVLDNDLPLDPDLETRRRLNLGQAAPDGETGGEQRGCALHDASSKR